MNWKKMEDLVDSNLAIRFPSRKYLDCLLLDFYINTMICSSSVFINSAKANIFDPPRTS